MLKELMASSGDHGDEGYKLLEVALCIPIAVQCLHDFVHGLLVFDLLKGQKQAAKAGEDRCEAQMVTRPRFSSARMPESLFRGIPNSSWLFPISVGALPCTCSSICATAALLKRESQPRLCLWEGTSRALWSKAVLPSRGRKFPWYPTQTPAPSAGCCPCPATHCSCRAGAKCLMHCWVKKPLPLRLLPVGDGVSGAGQLLCGAP